MAGVAGLEPTFTKFRRFPTDRVFWSKKMAGVAGLEPTTPGFGDQCSTN